MTLLFFTYPVFVTVWAVGPRAAALPARLTVLALGCAVVGAVIVVGTGGGLAIETPAWCSRSPPAVTYSAYLIGSDLVLRRTSPLTSAMWVSAGASIGPVRRSRRSRAGRARPQVAPDWWAILGMGLASAGAFVCLLGGARSGSAPSGPPIISATEPLSAAFLGWVFLGESVSLGTALGGALILAGAVVASLARAATPQEQQIP